MKVTEKILVVLCIIGAFLKLNSVEGGLILSALSFCLLSLFYLFFSFLFFNEISLKSVFRKSAYENINWKKILWAIFVGLACYIDLMGILFIFGKWEGAGFLIYVGTFSSLFIFSISLIAYLLTHSKFQLRILIRIGMLALICVFIYLKSFFT